jgi:hypothetical protein
MAEQYCAALMAWTEGKRVEWRVENSDEWILSATFFPAIATSIEFRIIDEPPKLREFWVYRVGGGYFAHDTYPGSDECYYHVREVSAAADAESAELRRNHDAMKAAIRDFMDTYAVHGGYLANQLDKHEVKL